MSRYRLLLASASPARLSTLTAAGITPAVRVSNVDEDAVLSAAALASEHDLEPTEQVLILARAKAEDVAAALLEEARSRPAGTSAAPDDAHAPSDGPAHLTSAAPETDDALPHFVLGCDSLFELDGTVYGKPHDADVARERWHLMRGATGTLHTGHWLVDLREHATGRVAGRGETSHAHVHFADLTDEEIDAYVASGEPLRVAGAFTIDGRGGPFIERVDGDHHGVVGLSLPLLRTLLAERSVTIPDLWD